MLSLKIPSNLTTSADKTEYAYKTQAMLRYFHNQKGQDYLDGKITKSEWLDWKDTVFEPRSKAIIKVIADNRKIFFESTKYNPNMTDAFEET